MLEKETKLWVFIAKLIQTMLDNFFIFLLADPLAGPVIVLQTPLSFSWLRNYGDVERLFPIGLILAIALKLGSWIFYRKFP